MSGFKVGLHIVSGFHLLNQFFFPCVEWADDDLTWATDCSYMLRNESQEFILV